VSAEGVAAAIGAARLLPVVRVDSAGAATEATAMLASAGVGVVELTATTPDWSRALRTARADHPDVVLGLGTVTDADTAERALAAGVDFLVSPYPRPDVRRVAEGAGVLFLEGGFTPGEVAEAARRGPAKVFPAHLGGPSYLRSLRAIAPGARLIPTGGIALAEVSAYLAAGAFAVGVGSDLTAAGGLSETDLAERLAAALDAPVAP
jgi:2-dehydro-3-deoxyphosphogluconate aldolase / (4S)-4-hydroxy-2-oxoglutarate aldolase